MDLIAVAGSFGAIGATRQILAALPGDFPAPLVIVQHRADRAGHLTRLLQRDARLRVCDVRPGEAPAPGTIYVADCRAQLVLEEGGCFAVEGDGDARCRADPLFASAAAVHRDRLVAVVLSGRLDDGARGVVAVKSAGGRVIVQDAATAVAYDMPAAAVATGCVDFVLPVASIASALITFAMAPAAGDLFRVSRPSWALTA